MPTDEAPRRLADISYSHSSNDNSSPLQFHRDNSDFWEFLTGTLTELAQPNPTLFTSSSGLFSRVDRIYTSIQLWCILQLYVQTGLLIDSHIADADGLSDHAPVSAVISLASPKRPDSKPIAPKVFQYSTFQLHFDKLCERAKIWDMATIDRWYCHKDLLKIAASRTLKDMHNDPKLRTAWRRDLYHPCQYCLSFSPHIV